MSEEIDKLAGATSLKISEMTLESDLTGAEKFPFVREGVKDNFIITLNRIKEYINTGVCQYVRDLRETDLDTFKGGNEADIALVGVQRNNKFATPENHYPIEEAGILIIVGVITDKTNQIYQTYDSNRLFMRCATSSGLDGEFSEWQEIAKISDVLTKNNTTPFSPTNDYQPATKKYVDDNVTLYFKINNDKFLSYLGTPAYYKDGDAETAITYVFNTIDNFKNFVNNALDYRYALVFINRTTNEKMYIRDYHVYRSSNGNYEFSFIFIYSENNGGDAFELITTRVFMSYNASNGYKYIVRNLMQSDNLTTLTKKTKSEYDGIGTKDNSTMYAITE